MTRQTEVAYIALFKFIEEHVCKLEPESFMADFEKSLRNAIKKVYGNVTRRGCYFHLTQAVRKNAKKIPGLFNAMYADKAKDRIYTKLLVLPLLPPAKIREGFKLVEADAAPFGKEFEALLKYFSKQWMNHPVRIPKRH